MTIQIKAIEQYFPAALLISRNLQKEIWNPVFKGLKLDTLVLGGNTRRREVKHSNSLDEVKKSFVEFKGSKFD